MVDELDDELGGLPDGEGEADAGATPPADAAPPVAAAEAEPFLKIDDRNVFKDRDAATAAFNERQQLLSKYRPYGSPEEIGSLKAENARLKTALGADPAPANNGKPKPTAEEIARHKEWLDQFGPELGIVTQEQLREQETQRLATQARALFDSRSRELDIDATPEDIEDMEEFAVAVLRNPKNVDLNRQFFSGNITPLVERVMQRFYGAHIKARETAAAGNGATAARGPDGKFLSAAATAATKAKMGNIPSAPPKSGAAGAPAGQPPKPLPERSDRAAEIGRILDAAKEGRRVTV